MLALELRRPRRESLARMGGRPSYILKASTPMRPGRVLLAFVAACGGLSACEGTQAVSSPIVDSASVAAAPMPAPTAPNRFYAGLSSGLLISPIGLDFGDVQVGATAPQQIVTITNISSLQVTMSGAGGAPPDNQFNGVQNCQGISLAPDQSCKMFFSMTPAGVGALASSSNGSWNGQPFAIELRGAGVAPHFLITPARLDFGDVVVGATAPAQDVTITNDGLAPVQMSGAGGAPPSGHFGGVQSCQGLTLAVGASCKMSFAFSPVAVGELSDQSVGSWNNQNFSIQLHGTGVAQPLLISPGALEFGEVAVGTVSPSQTVTITNIGSDPAVMSGAGGAPPTGQFSGSQSCQGITLAPGGSCHMTFDFQPGTAGSHDDASVGTWNNVPFHIGLHGTGLAVAAQRTEALLISPSALEFGDVTIGSTSPAQPVRITNVSSASIVMSGAGGAPPNPRFSGSQACQGLTLAPGASCQMSFAFQPTAEGDVTSASAGTWNGQNFNVALHGTGRTPRLLITATALEFGDVQTGSTSPNQVVSITNLSPVPVVMSGAGGAPPDAHFGAAQSCQGLTLATGEHCTMIFSFAPTAAGALTSASIGNWNGVPFDIALNGTGVSPRFLVTPFALDFGLVPVGITAPDQTTRIINVGRAAVVMSGAGGAPPSGRFGGAQNCQGTTLAVGASCTMFFAFSPITAGLVTDASAGTWNLQPFHVALQGTGFGVAVQDMDIAPATISLTATPATNVILLSTASFDASTVTLANVRMLVAGATEVMPVSRNGSVVTSTRDWNGDGLMDRMFSFRTSSLVAAGLATGAGPDALVLQDMLSVSKWSARDATPPSFVP